MRALILGSDWLLGHNIALTAIAAGWSIRVLTPSEDDHLVGNGIEGESVEYLSGDPNQDKALSDAMRGCDIVFLARNYLPPNGLHHHRREQEAREFIDHFLQAVKVSKPGGIVYTSSVATIGASDSPTRLPDEWNPYRLGRILHPYWDTQLIQEEALLAFHRTTGLPTYVLNVAKMLGPHDRDLSNSRDLVRIARRGTRQYVPGRISIADARDVAAAHLVAPERARSGERYILAGHNVTRQVFVSALARGSKRPAPDKIIDPKRSYRLTRLSQRLSCLGRPNRPFPAMLDLEIARRCTWYDSGKARDELRYRNRPLKTTVRDTVAWLRQSGVLR
ncbi:MAG: NAD-dependent epimerase/dehydratase family protein [Chloroflexota bacterium]